MKMPQQCYANNYNISEIFYSIQGEGSYVGTAAVFVRLAGCSMGCSWCDTKYANAIKSVKTAQQILLDINQYPAKTVILTGGEPTEQNLAPLLQLLHTNGWQIHMETNGSINTDTALIHCTTVSPKKTVCIDMLKKANVIKLVVDDIVMEATVKQYLKYATGKTQIYIQPEGNKKENIQKCVQIIKNNPQVKLSLQLHKMLNIR